jgi:IS30 family transposase
LSAAGRKELWERWSAGESISDIARALKKAPGSIHGLIGATGGLSPPVRRGRGCALTPPEREEISRGLATGDSLRAIAARLDRPASTVCREVNRNGGRGRYRAQKAEERAWERARRPKRCLLAIDDRLRDLVAEKLKADWSPEQISGWLRKEYPEDEAMYVSHETIYRTLFVQARGVLKRELLAHLRSRRMVRKGRHASTRGQPRGQIKEAVSICERPPEVEDRAMPGHWEGDLISGSRDTHKATLAERTLRFVMLVRLSGKDTESVVATIGEQVRRLPGTITATLTWDRGPEMAAHKKFTVATDVSVYFCDPKSPWQRGTSENTNRLLRQYLPRRTGLSVYNKTST